MPSTLPTDHTVNNDKIIPFYVPVSGPIIIVYLNIIPPQKYLLGQCCYYNHFTDGQTDETIFPDEAGVKEKRSNSEVCAPNHCFIPALESWENA